MTVLAIVSITSGILGLLVLAILFGPAAVITGTIAAYQAGPNQRGMRRTAIAGSTLGMACTLLAMVNVSAAAGI